MKIVILAAGFGSRLWPLSTSEVPKQFQPIIAGQSPLQYSFKLFTQLSSQDEIYVVTLRGLDHLVREQLPNIEDDHIVSVPERRNTLPHTIFALNSIASNNNEPILFTTVDHLITEETQFINSMKQILQDSAKGIDNVVLIGNHSDLFDPNAGYIAVNEDLRVLSFKEKPSQLDMDQLKSVSNQVIKDTAMFIASKSTFAAALDTYSGDESTQVKKLLDADAAQRTESFLAMPFVDIATGFYEKAKSLRASFSDGDFIDLGSFGSLYKIWDKDDRGNVTVGNIIIDDRSQNNYLFNQSKTPLVVINLQDSVVVQGNAGTVIAPKSDINAVGEIYKTYIYSGEKH